MAGIGSLTIPGGRGAEVRAQTRDIEPLCAIHCFTMTLLYVTAATQKGAGWGKGERGCSQLLNQKEEGFFF